MHHASQYGSLLCSQKTRTANPRSSDDAESNAPSPQLIGVCSFQDSGTFWFNASSVEDRDAFVFMGLVVGLAIYNSVLLDCPLPQALYRKLLGQQCTLRDLDDMDPVLGKSLGQLLSYEGTPLRLGLDRQHAL